MRKSAVTIHRRDFVGSAIMAAAGFAFAPFAVARDKGGKTYSLFNGKSLAGWIIAENNAGIFSAFDITDLAALAKAIAAQSNPVGAFIGSELDDDARKALSAYNPSDAGDEKSIRSALAKSLNKIVSGPLVYDAARFHGVRLSSKTKSMLNGDAQGKDLIKLNRMLLADALPAELRQLSAGWIVKNGVMASTGAGRGVIYTARDYGRFRLMFTMRHVSGDPDHQACILVFCTRPEHDQTPLDALGGIQFQVPKGGHWDYRSGHNNAGGVEFVEMQKPGFDPHEWSRVEIVADAVTGAVRMAVAQPVGSKAVEVLEFHDPNAGKPGPIALQMHNAGLFDEYKDMTIEENPPTLDLTTTA
jgi:hypothetical protein